MGLKTALVTNTLNQDPRAEKTIVEALGLGGIRMKRLTLTLSEIAPPTVEAEIYVDDQALERLPGLLSGLAEGCEFARSDDVEVKHVSTDQPGEEVAR